MYFIIIIIYSTKDYELLVMETKPENAVSIIECDMKVCHCSLTCCPILQPYLSNLFVVG